jgi:hypothetical protein
LRDVGGAIDFARWADEAATGGVFEGAKRDVFANVPMRKEAETLAIFGNHGHSGGAGFCRMTKADGRAAQLDLAIERILRGTEEAF